MKNPFLIGERVYFRPLEREDAATVMPWFNDPEIRPLLRTYQPKNLRSEQEFIEQMQSDEHALVLLLALREDDRAIGISSLHQIEAKNRKAEFGITIGYKSFWGQGFGSAALHLMIHHAFAGLNLNRVHLHVYEFNERAIRCYEKMGFQKEGVLRQDHYCNGRFWDTWVMALLRSDWEATTSSGPRSAEIGQGKESGA